MPTKDEVDRGPAAEKRVFDPSLFSSDAKKYFIWKRIASICLLVRPGVSVSCRPDSLINLRGNLIEVGELPADFEQRFKRLQLAFHLTSLDAAFLKTHP